MDQELDATGRRLVALHAKLRARENVAGYEKNVEMLKAEIARLETKTLRPAPPATR